MPTTDSPSSNARSTLRLRPRGDLDMWSGPQLDDMVDEFLDYWDGDECREHLAALTRNLESQT